MILFLITLGTGKIDSAKGRLLIWKVSLQMLPDALPFGFGYGGFEKYYMNYQADYFRHHTDSAYAMLADNTSTPFNEYLHLVIDYGLIGLSILVVLIILYVRWYNKCSSNRRYASLCSMLSIGILAMYSYPFLYPVTWIMLAFNFLCIIPRRYWDYLNLHGKHIAICLIPIVICTSVFSIKRDIAEWKWCKYSEMSHAEKKNSILQDELDLVFFHNPYYNYEKALERYEAKDYDGALHNLTICEDYMADYDVQLLKVQSLLHLKRYNEAEQFAKHAHYMCPNRFYPLYYLTLAYYAENKETMMLQTCEEIMNKKIKVNSWDIMVIKHLTRKLHTDMNKICIESLIDLQ